MYYFTKTSLATMIFFYEFLQVFDKQKGAEAGTAIRDFGSAPAAPRGNKFLILGSATQLVADLKT